MDCAMKIEDLRSAMERKASLGGRVEQRARFHLVFVGIVHRETNLGILWKIFSEYGVVADVYLPNRKQGDRRCIDSRFITVWKAFDSRRLNVDSGRMVFNQGLYPGDFPTNGGRSFKEVLIKQGVGVILSPLFDKSILITFFSKEEMNILLKDYSNMFEKWFSSVTPGMEDKVERQHQVWIRLEDVPLILWHWEFFSKIPIFLEQFIVRLARSVSIFWYLLLAVRQVLVGEAVIGKSVEKIINSKNHNSASANNVDRDERAAKNSFHSSMNIEPLNVEGIVEIVVEKGNAELTSDGFYADRDFVGEGMEALEMSNGQCLEGIEEVVP
ncbi:hypothetical protein COLO4_16394 [Corchorus olitorius]|uniref:Uncharacterized protein n=1 Tax=Corchorus olitorius TaxID=93759 RepID=A0A1R3JHT5_9ROSI|nr:hypothetical protein COLO4_16394 [Corchorus olitorius]